MKTLDKSMSIDERNEITKLFANWLQRYTSEVIARVMKRREEIVNNEFAMHLLRELKEREDQEAEEFESAIDVMLFDYEYFKEHDPHNHVLLHAKSYADVLHDMYIKK